MAGIQSLPNGTKKMQLVCHDGRRRSIYFGKVSMKQAEAIRVMVDDLHAASITGQTIKRSTATWLRDDCPQTLHKKLAAIGLVDTRGVALLGDFTERYIDQHAGKDSTKDTLRRARKHLLGFFDLSRDMRTITEADAAEWSLWMRKERKPKLAENTARKTIGIARQFWKQAKRLGCVDDHPFGDLSATVKGNPKRMHFVTLDEAQRLLEGCPSLEWRTLVALARFGGLRIPSEIQPLEWSHVDWANGRFKVHASKTEHHDNGGIRDVPIFDPLYPYLMAAYEAREAGERYILPTLRQHTNPGTHLKRIVKRAGLTPWPKLWQNMRSTRETELIDSDGITKACAWCGNSPAVALKHYDQLRDDDYRQAAPKAVQNAVQHIAASGGKAVQGAARAMLDTARKSLKNNPLQVAAGECSSLQGAGNGPYWT